MPYKNKNAKRKNTLHKGYIKSELLNFRQIQFFYTLNSHLIKLFSFSFAGAFGSYCVILTRIIIHKTGA